MRVYSFYFGVCIWISSHIVSPMGRHVSLATSEFLDVGLLGNRRITSLEQPKTYTFFSTSVFVIKHHHHDGRRT